MSRTQRFGLLGLAVVVVVVAAIVIGTSGGGSDVKSAGPTTIEVKDAKPVGGVKTITYKKGDTIDLTVKSDTADEVHFHGYDVHKDVEAGGSVTFKMPASIDGEFIVELEDHKETLANVKVEP
jgi:hypothetical protein